MRKTGYTYQQFQDAFPELFIETKKSTKTSANFDKVFLPTAALADPDGNFWGQYASREIPLKKRTIVISFNNIKDMPFSELTQIDETARLLKRAGFTVLIPVGDQLQNYDMQLFNHYDLSEEDLENIEESLRGRVCNISEVGNKTRAEMANCALAQKKVKADELFFIDDVKKELDSHYLANFVSRCNVLSKKTENNQASIALNIDFDCFSIEDQPELAKIICTADYPIILNISVRGLSKTSFNILSEIIQNAIMPITLNFRAVGQDENWVKLINEIKNAKQPITLNLPGGYSNVLSSAGIDALADAIQYAKQPINLTLSLGDQDVAKLVNAIQNAAQDITIKFNPKPLSSESVSLLIDAAKNSKRLIKLDFSQVGLSALQVVESIRYARQPVSFLIENSHFLDKIAVEQLLDAIQNTRQPITLEFDKNYMLNEKYILEIIKALRMTKQSITLNFKAYSLASNVLAALVDAVQNAAGPITLNLTGHTLDTFNLSTLTNAIKFAKHPITLNLSSSRLRDDSFNALIDIIQNTAQALMLDLRDCQLEPKLVDRFITELEVAIKNTKQPITPYLSASPFSAAFINTLIKAIQDTNNPITLHISDSASECDALSLMALKKQVENSKRPVTFTVTSVGNLELVKYLSRRQQNEEVVFNRQDKREITYQCSLQDDDGAASLPLYDLDKEQFAVNIEELCVDTSSAGCKYFLGEKFPNLKYLSVSSISSNRVIDIKAENLTHCELHFNHYTKKPMIMMDACFFLQRLDCFLEAWGEGYNFPINISLPNLLELHIHGALYSLTSLFSFFEETPHLRLLELTNTNVSNSDLKEINTLYPRLTVIIHGMNRSNTQSAETVPHGFGERLFTESHTTERQLGAPPSRPETPDEGREKDIVYMSSTAAGELVSDFNTQHNPNKTCTLQAACKHISTQEKNRFKYTRDAIYTLDKNSQLAPVKAHQFSDYQLPDYQIKLPADSKHDFFEFKQPIYLKEGQAYPLTGLSANDILFQLTLNGKPLNEAQINGEIEITKDELGFYSLKAKKELRGNLGYLLDIPPEKNEVLKQITKELQEKIEYIQGFPEKEVAALIIAEDASPDKKLEAMHDQRKASCRHRVAIFLHQLRKLKTANPEDYKHIEARIVRYSGIHANIEISADSGENFEILELGGFEVKTQYVSTLLPKLQFSSKQKKDAPKPVFSDVLNQIKSGYGKNTLLCLQNESDVYPCLSHIRQTALPNRPIFYVDFPDSLRTSLKRLKLNAERTRCEIVEPNPGAGLLYDFLMMHQHSDPPPIIVINWDNFKPKDIVQFNSVIDIDKRRTGKTPIPVNATIVGLHSRDEKMLDLLCDTSFVSRHAKGGIHDFSDKPLPDRAKTLTASSAAVVPKVLKINLHQSPRWLDIAVGKAFVDGEKLCWQDGQLLDIFADSAISHVEFINPPIHDRSFEYFIADLRAGLPITVLNQQMSIDRSIDVTISDQLTFENNVDIFIQRSAALKEDTFIINSSIFEQCLQGKRIKEDGLLISEKGLIEAHENNKLKLCISDTLSDSQWSLLLDYAKRFHVVLEISVTDNVVLPPTLQFVALPAKLNTLSSQPNRFIVSDDVELSVANIQEKLPSKTMVIDFSEVSLDDLFCGITHTTTDIGFLFYKQFSSVWEALSRGDTVILKGDCSKEKLDYLASLFSSQPYFYFEGQKHFFPGKLIVVADQTLKPPDWLHAEEQIVREEQGYLQKLQLQKKAAVPPLVLDVPDSEDLSLNASDLFEENRIKSVKHIFSFSPYALLEGAPGVGKSYFVRVLENDPAIKLYREDEIEKWASDPDELIDINDPLKGFKQKILFRDEINLRATDCSQDRDLMNDPPSIFINGKHYFLTENCKILYAQNPVDYGGKRCEPKLFQDLPDCKVTFEQMSPAFIFHHILKPIFGTLFDKDESKIRAQNILENYFLTMESVRDLVAYAITECGKEYERRRAVVASEDMAAPPINHDMVCIGKKDFVLTPSRYAVYDTISTLLQDRNFKRSLKDDAPDGAKYGGVNGLILQGAPGVGKSELIAAILDEKGYSEINDPKTTVEQRNDGKVYYRLNAEASIEQILKTLHDAFQQGAILVVDEIDGCNLLEDFINAYLTGADVHGRRPEKPGFTILSTANGAAMQGRESLSAPLLSRVILSELNEYPCDDLIQVSTAKFIPPMDPNSQLKLDMISFLVDEFLGEQRTDHETPPTYRDLDVVSESYFKKQFENYVELGLSKSQHEFMLAYRKHPKLNQLVNQFESNKFTSESTLAEMKAFLTSPNPSALFGRANSGDDALPGPVAYPKT